MRGNAIKKTSFGLEVDESRSPYTVLAVKGEAEIHNAPQLREKPVELASSGHRHVVVHLDGVSFLDSTGLGMLVGGLTRLRKTEGDPTLVCTHPAILRISN